MKVEEKVTLVFKNKEGDKKELVLSIKEMLERSLDDIYDDLEDVCTSSSCNNESQNFCDCSSEYDDYEIEELILNETL